jgi:hypothetical protein
MTQFPQTEAKVSYDHLTFRSTVDILKAETRLDWNEFWMRVRDTEVMNRVAEAMLSAAAIELSRARPAKKLEEDSGPGSTSKRAAPEQH